MFRSMLLSSIALLALSLPFQANSAPVSAFDADAQAEELNPFDPNVEQYLEEYDQIYEEETGESPWLPNFQVWGPGCYRASCPVWVQVVKSTQTLNLYLNGQLSNSWKVSTGVAGRETPRFDKNPDGRIYTAYTSRKFPGGNYKGLGNMPYAVFIKGGFALHGTPAGNWSKLGRRASHGCIRQHPDNAAYLNQLVRRHGVRNTWITVQ